MWHGSTGTERGQSRPQHVGAPISGTIILGYDVESATAGARHERFKRLGTALALEPRAIAENEAALALPEYLDRAGPAARAGADKSRP